MSTFPRIDPDDPFAEAARNVNTMSEERGLHATVAWLGIETDVMQLAYLAEQRALRAVAAAGIGHNLGSVPELTEPIARAIVETPLWKDLRMLLVGCYLDGMAIGWKANDIAHGLTAT